MNSGVLSSTALVRSLGVRITYEKEGGKREWSKKPS